MSGGLSDSEYVRRQYRDASRLNARVRLYQLYGTQDRSLHAWCFDGIDLESAARILELGTGTGSLWVENAERVPAGAEVTVSDLSPGMLATARQRIGEAGLRPAYARLDAASIPYRDACFDIVIANHMLYHVPDRRRALAETRRVLVPGGHLYVLTNGWSHLIEIEDLCQRFGLEVTMGRRNEGDVRFDIETAAREILEVYSSVRVRSRRDDVEVEDAGPLIDYLRSLLSDAEDGNPALDVIRRHVSWWIELEGSFHIGAWVGQLDATR